MLKVKAVVDHECYCCQDTIKKGEDCLIFMVTPSKPEENEFDTIYMHMSCGENPECKRLIEAKHVKKV